MINKSLPLSVIALLAFLAIATGCARQASPPARESIPPTVSGNAVTIKGFAFAPQTLTIKTGTTVTWTNNDTAPHTVKSSVFESPQLAQGQSFPYTFNQVGTYDYNCGIHPSMKGQIMVER